MNGTIDCNCFHCAGKPAKRRGLPPCEYANHHCEFCHEKKICTEEKCMSERGIPTAGRELVMNIFSQNDVDFDTALVMVPSGASALKMFLTTHKSRHTVSMRSVTAEPKPEGEVFTTIIPDKWNDFEIIVPGGGDEYKQVSREFSCAEIGVTGGGLLHLGISPFPMQITLEFT